MTGAGGLIMLAGLVVMLVSSWRASFWSVSLSFEVGLALLIGGVLVTLAGAIGALFCGAAVWLLRAYPLS